MPFGMTAPNPQNERNTQPNHSIADARQHRRESQGPSPDTISTGCQATLNEAGPSAGRSEIPQPAQPAAALILTSTPAGRLSLLRASIVLPVG